MTWITGLMTGKMKIGRNKLWLRPKEGLLITN